MIGQTIVKDMQALISEVRHLREDNAKLKARIKELEEIKPPRVEYSLEAPPGVNGVFESDTNGRQLILRLKRLDLKTWKIKQLENEDWPNKRLRGATGSLLRRRWIKRVRKGLYAWHDLIAKNGQSMIHEHGATFHPVWSSGACLGYVWRVGDNWAIKGQSKRFEDKQAAIDALKGAHYERT